MKVHHIGYLVKDVNKALKEFIAIGFVQEDVFTYDELRQVQIAFIIKDGYRIELVAPKSKDSAICNLHKKIGNCPYHVCYEVENMQNAVADMENLGYIAIVEPEKAPALDNCKVVFMFNANIGLIELMEADRNECV